jgi:tetratricopeptide (TPR) repeat protein
VTLLLLLSALTTASAVDTVAVPVDSVLRGPDEPDKEKPAVGWMTAKSVTTVTPEETLVRVRTEVVVQPTDGPVWVNLRVLDGSVLLTEDSGLSRGSDNHWWYTARIDRPTTVTAVGLISASTTQVALAVAPAVRQEVRTEGAGLDFLVDGAVDGFLPPTARLRVSWTPETAEAPKREVLQATVATAAWYEDNALWMRSKVRFSVRRGEVSRFVLSLPAGLNEVDVQAPGATWQMSGNQLVLVTDSPVEGALDVTVQGRLPFTSKTARLTQVQPQGASSTSWTMTLAGTSEALLSPAVSGMHPAALSELPPDARSIGDAPPTVAWTGKGQLTVTALQLQSLDGPALVIDKAVCTEATSVGGRSMLRCRMDVRNASAQFLRVKPPPGMSLWSARVNTEGVAPVTAEPWTAVPLQRSVETLVGLTQLDVDLTFVADDEAWETKGERQKALPAFDAPVAVLEWELRLPPGYRGEVEGGSVDVLQEATTEIVYATAGKQDKMYEDDARDSWNSALTAYQDNDFEVAQTYINETLELDPDNANAIALQSNLDVFSGEDGGRYDTVEEEALSRKVKDTAKAKVAYKEVEEVELVEEAEQSMLSGDYERAENLYAQAAEISEDLAQYDQVESNENSYRANESRKKAEEARNRRGEEQNRVTSQTRTVIDFEGVEVDGELVKPQGALIVDAGPGRDYGQVYGGEEPDEPTVAVYYDNDELMFEGEMDELAVFGDADMNSDITGGVGGLIGAKGTEVGSGGLGSRGSGLGGGGTAEGLGGLGTKGRGSGASGYGSGGGSFGEAAPSEPQTVEVYDGLIELGYYEDDSDSFDDYAVYDPEPMPMAEPEPESVPMDAPDMAYTTSAVVVSTEQISRVVVNTPGVTTNGAPSPPPPPAKKPASRPTQPTSPPPVTGVRVDLRSQPDLAATTWGVPLPEHGQPVVLTQRLLAPGEAATVTLKYRETR